MVRKRSPPVDLSPGPLPGKAVLWRCWLTDRSVELEGEPRKIIAGPIEVSAPSHFLARQEAARLLRCCPLRVRAELC